MKKGNIILFDGICIFCNSFVKFVAKRDSKKVFKLCHLQSKTAKKLSAENNFFIDQKNPDSFIFLKDGKVFYKSDAAIRVIKELGALWNLCRILLLIPKSIRDFFYDYVGKRRYRWFGKKESCEIDGEEIRQRIMRD